MKKIIKGAFQRFVTDCQRCGCQFEYEIEDVVSLVTVDNLTGYDVICPDCGFHTHHHSDEGLPSSRKHVDVGPEEMGEGWCAGCYGRHPKLFLYNDKDGNGYWLCKSCYDKGQVN